MVLVAQGPGHPVFWSVLTWTLLEMLIELRTVRTAVDSGSERPDRRRPLGGWLLKEPLLMLQPGAHISVALVAIAALVAIGALVAIAISIGREAIVVVASKTAIRLLWTRSGTKKSIDLVRIVMGKLGVKMDMVDRMILLLLVLKFVEKDVRQVKNLVDLRIRVINHFSSDGCRFNVGTEDHQSQVVDEGFIVIRKG